jgi:hypothetical protein
LILNLFDLLDLGVNDRNESHRLFGNVIIQKESNVGQYSILLIPLLLPNPGLRSLVQVAVFLRVEEVHVLHLRKSLFITGDEG